MVDFYLQRGEIALKEAEILAQSGYYLGCVNRLYYAAFYNVSGYLFLKGFTPKSHKGVVKLFNHEAMTNTFLVTADARFFHALYEWRQEGDYGDFITFNKEEILELIMNTKALIKKIRTLIIDDADE
jgi:uncharacterized protein (UPF0332 family)